MAYEPDPRDWEQKSWLYEKYWGEKLGTAEIGDEVGVSGHTIRKQMDKLGIPRRTTGYKKENEISPFAGFYDGDTSSRSDDETREAGGGQFDPDKRRDTSEIDWSTFGPDAMLKAD